jgi:hypothetical protein
VEMDVHQYVHQKLDGNVIDLHLYVYLFVEIVLSMVKRCVMMEIHLVVMDVP